MPYSDPLDQKKCSQRWYQRNKDKVKEKTKSWKQRNPIKLHLQEIKSRAKRQSLECDLDLEWFTERMAHGLCEVTNLPFVPSEKKMGPFLPSVDRTDPKKGYTKDNCKMVIWMYNAAKGSNTHDYVMIMARALCIQYYR